MNLIHNSDEKRSINVIPIERWRNLYKMAIQIRDLAPWEWLEESDSFGIEDYITGWTGYTCAMGGLGTYFGVNFYLGDQGYRNLLAILTSGESQDIEPLLREQDCLALSFDSRQDMEKPDLTLIRRLKLKCPGPNAYPCFRRHEPGFYPWFLTPTEAEFLERILPVFIDTIVALEKGILQLSNNPDLLLRTINPDKSVDTRVVEAPRKGSRSKKKPKYVWDELALKRTVDNCVKSGQNWEIGCFRSPEAVQAKKNERPFFPEVLLLTENKSLLVLDMDMFENKAELFQSLVERVRLAMESQKTCPARIVTDQPEFKRILFPALAPRGISVSLSKSMKAWNNIAYELHKKMLESLQT